MSIGRRIADLRRSKKLTQKELAERVEISRAALSHYEKDRREPDYEVLERLANFFEVSADYLLGRTDDRRTNWDKQLPELTEKDERDIAIELEKIINNLHSDSGYSSFDGVTMDEMDEEDRDLLIASLENSLRLAKRMAKQKFTPKKYRKED